MGAFRQPSREREPAEARRAIKVPLFFHADKHETQFWKGCPANQTAFQTELGRKAMGRFAWHFLRL